MEAFSPTETLRIQEEIASINSLMRDQGRGYILIGPGRWGTRDRFLGVPVLWQDISQARVVVEADMKEFRIEASQGTHFLHNVVGMNVGYLKVRYDSDTSYMDWGFLTGLNRVMETHHCVLARSEGPLPVRMDGKTGRIVVLKELLPGPSPEEELPFPEPDGAFQ